MKVLVFPSSIYGENPKILLSELCGKESNQNFRLNAVSSDCNTSKKLISVVFHVKLRVTLQHHGTSKHTQDDGKKDKT